MEKLFHKSIPWSWENTHSTNQGGKSYTRQAEYIVLSVCEHH